jgi:hypothetical protein
VIRFDAVIAELVTREQQWRRAHAAVASELADVRTRRDALAARVSARSATTAAAPAAAGPAAAAPSAAEPPPAGAPEPGEVSTRTVQTLLFVIGGLLLGAGAIVFTAVAWTTFGVTGRAAVLAAATALVLTAPLVALHRRLRGTAETFAVLGLLLVVLDGYAIWSVDLFGARDVAPATWTGLVCLAAAAVAAGYARATRLSGPAYAALLLIQPVLPMLAVEHRPGVTGWAYVWVALAAVNLAARWWWRGAGPARRVLAWVLTGATLVIAALVAVVELLAAGTVAPAALAAGALLAVVVVLAGVAGLTRAGGWLAVTAAAAVAAVALAAVRIALLVLPEHRLVAAAVVVATVAVATAGVAWRWPRVRRGAKVGALLSTAVLGLVLVVAAVSQAWVAVDAAWQGAPRTAATALFDWQLPAALLLATAAVVVLAPGWWRGTITAGVALASLSLSAVTGPVLWAPAAGDLVVAAVLGAAAVQTHRSRSATAAAAAAGVLVGHALLVGFATAASTAAVLGALVLLGVAIAVRAWQRDRSTGPVPVRTGIGRASLLAGLLAVPGAVAATLTAAGADPVWPPRAALAAAALLVAAVALARWAAPAYLSTAAAAVHVATPVSIIGGIAEEPAVVSVYAGVALLVLVATGWLRRPSHPVWWLAARAPAAVVVLASVATQVTVVLFGPYEWLSAVWRGAPTGSGVTVTVIWPDNAAGPVGLALLAAAAVLAARVLARRWAAGAAAGLLVAPVALLVGMAQLELPWPLVPVTSLALGIAALLAAARSGPVVHGVRGVAGVATVYGSVLAAAGLTGALPTRWSTLTALAVALAAAVAAAVVGRRIGARVAGWVAAVVLAVLLAVAATLAAGWPLASASLAVLAAAAAALAAGGWRRARRAEAVALESGAHAAAVVALLLPLGTEDAPGRAALAAALWGVLLGLRALWPGEAPAGRVGRAAAAVGVEVLAWWLLLVSQQVTTVEAYTVPAAVVAAGAGALALRARPRIGSWVAYGPALAAGFLPSLYASLIDPQPLRRLLLGAAAVAVVMVGAGRRWQAPVVVGGAMALVVAGRELALVWQLLDTWIPLTVAGLLLVGLAATYERRRRDLARLRQTVRRMT